MYAIIVIAVIAGLLVLAAAIVLVIAGLKPDTFRVERSADIQAPPDKPFALISDFHSWPSWSPWERIDPDMKRTYSGAESGRGAAYEWLGNKKVGQGRMEIKDAAPPARITMQLDFLKPFEAHNQVEFTLIGYGDSTKVNWAMFGRRPFMFKVMTVFFSMDKMVGKDFEAGLANLKALAER